MGAFTAGEIILLPFPFSDLTQSKVRPALLISGVGRGDWVVCQITSNPYGDPVAISLKADAFERGNLQRESYVRPGKLFTANESLILGSAAAITEQALDRVRDAVVEIIRGKNTAESQSAG